MKKLFIASLSLFSLLSLHASEQKNKACNSCNQCQTCSYNKPISQNQNESLQENLEEQTEKDDNNKEIIQGAIATVANVAQSVLNIT